MYFNQIQIVPAPGRHAEQVPKDFFYSRIIEKNNEDFRKISPQSEFNDKFKQLIEQQREKVSTELEEFGEPVSTVAPDVLFADETIRLSLGKRIPNMNSASATKYTGDQTEHPVLLFLLEKSDRPHYRRSEDQSNKLRIEILAKTSDDGKSFVGFFGEEAHEISKYVGDYATIKELTSGGELIHGYFNEKVDENSNLTDWYQDVEDDPFEDEVFDRVRNLSGVSLENIRIEADVGDNPDFDAVALPLGEFGTGFAIEVKNYLQEDNEEVDTPPAEEKDSGELRSELIRKPKDYAEQADLKLISIAKGLSEEQYSNLRRLAESSNVILLNENNYEESLEEVLFERRFRELANYVV